jgi:hypothetical protein
VLIPHEAAAAGVALREEQVPDDAEPGRAVGTHELVGMGPAVEADAEAPVGQHPVELSKGRHQPAVVVVVGTVRPLRSR